MIDPALWKARFADWLEVRFRSSDTRHNYLAGMNPFLGFVLALGLTSWAEVNQDVLEEYRAHVFGLRNPRTGNALRGVPSRNGKNRTLRIFDPQATVYGA